MEIIEFVAIFSSAIFSGAAIYINAAEHPARLECGIELAATVFGPSYRCAAAMQASLAIVATISGVAVYLNGGSRVWLFGALMIFLVIPFTFIAIMPTNKQLLDPGRDRKSEETSMLLKKWGMLHGVRSLLSTVALIAYIYIVVST